MTNPALRANLKDTTDLYNDIQNGTLPAVSFVDPFLTSDDFSPGDDDHPFADIRKGEEFLASIYNAVGSSPNWSSTVLIVNFDEWGGFFDHVTPPIAQVPQQEQAAYAAVNTCDPLVDVVRVELTDWRL